MKKQNLFNDSSVSEIKTKNSLRSLYKGVKIPWGGIILGLIVTMLAMLLLATQAENVALMQTGTHKDLSPFFAYTLLYIVDCAVFYLSVIGDKALVTLNTRVRKKMWTRILRISARDLEKENPASLLSRITTDSEYASMPFTILTVVFSVITFLLGLAGELKKMDLSSYGPIVGIAVLLALIVAIISVRMVFVVSTAKQNKIAKLTKYYSEQLGSTKFIKASRGEERTVGKALGLIEERYGAEKNYALYQLVNALTASVLQLALYGATFASAIVLLKSGALRDLTDTARFYSSFTLICGGLMNIVVLPQVIAETLGGTKKISYVNSMESEKLDEGDDFERSDISFRDVSFLYDDKRTIDGASMTFEDGKITAIVGPNGSGKSTVVKLLSRLYQAESGDILAGERPASSISLKSWRENFSVVSQNASLFSGTVKENILYGAKGEVSDEQLAQAVETAGLSEFVREKGLDYEIGVKGGKLSGGEQQRLAIARALIADKDYLILDEATANLDTRTEAEVIGRLFEAEKGKTVIVIAHTMDVVGHADNLIVLRDGKVEAAGPRQQIMASNSFMKAMEV